MARTIMIRLVVEEEVEGDAETMIDSLLDQGLIQDLVNGDHVDDAEEVGTLRVLSATCWDAGEVEDGPEILPASTYERAEVTDMNHGEGKTKTIPADPVWDKNEAWQNLMNRLDSSGEVLRMLHDDVDCMVPPDASAHVKRRAEEVKAALVLLAKQVNWISGVCDGGTVVPDDTYPT